MTHADPGSLTLLALGDPAVTEDVVSHVSTCSTCGDELADLRQVVGQARMSADVELHRPHPRVWAAIRDSVGRRELSGRAELLPVPAAAFVASGRAEVATDDHGRRMLQVTLDADLPADGLRYAWLVHRDRPDRHQPLGILDGTSGLWSVDHAIDLHQYAIVEITQQEPGSSQHSGQPVARGDLLVAAA